MPSVEENKSLARRYLDAWTTRDLTEFEAILAPGFVDYMMGERRTRAELLRDASDNRLTDVSQEVEAILADDSMASVKYTTTGTVAATNAPLRFTGMFILTIAEGVVTGGWGQFDRFGIRAQLSRTPQAQTPLAQYPRRSGTASGTPDSRKALCLQYLKAWQTGDRALFEQILTPDFVDYMMGQPRTRAEVLEQTSSTPPITDLEPRVDAILAEDDLVALHYTMSARHRMTGKPMQWTGMFIVTIDGDKISGGWGERDTVTIREQMTAASQ